MFKSMIIYRIADSWQSDLQVLEDALQKTVFAKCGATQERSVGWVLPRGEAHGPLVESVAGQWMMRFMTEAKVLPQCAASHTSFKRQHCNVESWPSRQAGLRYRFRRSRRLLPDASVSPPPHEHACP